MLYYWFGLCVPLQTSLETHLFHFTRWSSEKRPGSWSAMGSARVSRKSTVVRITTSFFIIKIDPNRFHWRFAFSHAKIPKLQLNMRFLTRLPLYIPSILNLIIPLIIFFRLLSTYFRRSRKQPSKWCMPYSILSCGKTSIICSLYSLILHFRYAADQANWAAKDEMEGGNMSLLSTSSYRLRNHHPPCWHFTLCSQLGAHHPPFACVDTLGDFFVTPNLSSYIRFFTSYHHEYTLVVPPSLCPHPVFEHSEAEFALARWNPQVHFCFTHPALASY